MERKWEHVFPSTVPGKRYGNREAWDKVRNEVVMHGGTAFLDTNGTWTWDGTDWTHKSPANPPPAGRYDFAFCFDEGNAYTIKFGGSDHVAFPFDTLYDETYTWDGTDWTQQTPTNKPSKRSWPEATWFDVGGYTLLYGGNDDTIVGGGFIFPSDTWSWDGTDWTSLMPATPPIPAGATGGRIQHVLGYDWVSQTAIMYGGTSSGVGGGNLQDTWEWDGTDWNQLFPATTPTMKLRMRMEWHPGLQMLIMALGDKTSSPHPREVWAWNRTDWELIDVCGTELPAARNLFGWSYDPATGKMLMSCGDLVVPSVPTETNETWLWGGSCVVAGVQVMRWW